MSAGGTASLITEQLPSPVLIVNSTQVTNDKVPPFVRALRFTTRIERLLFRKAPALVLRLSGLQTFARVVGDALGMPAPSIGAAGIDGTDSGAGLTGPQTWSEALWEAFEMGNVRSLGGMFNFLFSRWVLACLAMVWQMQSLAQTVLGEY